ncbi:MAG: PhoX family phosphatase [Pseudomonadales bacterium]|nr:PhoX family phosphatase [Pseudomonadales bacterium]
MTQQRPYIDTHQEQDDTNHSNNAHFSEVLQVRLSRRKTVLGGVSATAALMLGSLTGCSSSSDDDVTPVAPELKLGFTPVAKNLNDVVTVPTGYEVAVVYALGDALNTTTSAWANDGSESAESYEFRAGDHHDGMSFFGLGSDGKWSPNTSDKGLLCLNHENITSAFLHASGPTTVDGKRPVDEALKEINCHGVSVVAINRQSNGSFAVDKANTLNRRVTPNTVMEFHGPAAASRFLVTKYDAKAKKGRGTLNNCANGYTPWGTYLTCEENWAGYFKRPSTDDSLRSSAELASLKRYGVTSSTGANSWSTASDSDDRFTRWNATILDAAKTADTDFRNEPNTFGWVVEIDPFNSSNAPRKRTALGRFAHEGCAIAPVKAGKPVVFYMGDDSRGEYIYKFVSTKVWDAADATGGLTAGDKYMNDGKLYVAKFNADGTGKWLELSFGVNGLVADNAIYPFTSQAAVVVNARLAADSVGATKMDRPEWTAVHPKTGEVYLTLTNNSNRGTSYPVDAANPRNYTDEDGKKGKGNPNGHIIRWKEKDSEHSAAAFTWDVYVFAAEEDADKSKINVSNLTSVNDMSSPDGLWFDPRGVLWIQTDDGAYTDVTNCMMLAAVTGKVGDGAKTTIDGQDTFKGKNPTEENLRRFLVGPKECEITGVTMTPDNKAIFVNIQHPGEDGNLTSISSNWPDVANPTVVNANKTARPRSATIVIYRKDGKEIAV